MFWLQSSLCWKVYVVEYQYRWDAQPYHAMWSHLPRNQCIYMMWSVYGLADHVCVTYLCLRMPEKPGLDSLTKHKIPARASRSRWDIMTLWAIAWVSDIELITTLFATCAECCVGGGDSFWRLRAGSSNFWFSEITLAILSETTRLRWILIFSKTLPVHWKEFCSEEDS